LNECIAYVTIEPCSMCAGAFVLARIKALYFGAKDLKAGACGSCFNIANNAHLNHKVKIFGGLLDHECGQLMSNFFVKKRKEGAKLN
ncbi:MAG: nucleoside deaminase, partial [Candidatus Omnitrophica bacterium]|nr:nucleoside deaminase [Candidatus Omnitrophota bacterium]